MVLRIKILCLFLLVAGCQNPNQKSVRGVIEFDITELQEVSELKLSDLGFSDIIYIPLKTDEKSVISYIMDIEFSEEFFLVQSFNRIMKFLNNGSFVSGIGTEGRGPDEYLHVHDFEIDNKDNNIYIVSAWQNKFFVYSEDGQIQRTFECPLNTTQFKIAEDKILCYSVNTFANSRYSYSLIDTWGRLIRTYPNIYEWELTHPGLTVFETENIFFKNNNQLFKKEIYSDTIYGFKDFSFKPYAIIKHGKRLLSPKTRSDYDTEYIYENFIYQRSLFEFGDYLFYEFWYKNMLGKNNFSFAFIASKSNRQQVLISEKTGLKNDLDGGPDIWPIGIKDDSTIFAWIDAIKIKTFIDSEVFKNTEPIYPDKKKELEELANSLKETDNPVLILVSLKK